MDQLATRVARNGIERPFITIQLPKQWCRQVEYRGGDHGPYSGGPFARADAVMLMAQQLNAMLMVMVVPFDGTGSYGHGQCQLRSPT
jgi:hypothetical protein